MLNALLVVYSVLSIGLGVYGYTEKGSAVSLIAGGVAGVLMIGTVLLHKSKPRISRIASLVLAFAILGNFLPKFIKTSDWLPAGTMTVASALVIIALVLGHVFAMTAKKSATPTAG
jgi:uncharacterized membrane protein (UPF0136 family)